jgi:hypothetical protein
MVVDERCMGLLEAEAENKRKALELESRRLTIMESQIQEVESELVTCKVARTAAESDLQVCEKRDPKR